MKLIPLYIPTRKITVMTPKAVEKLAFILNYKGLTTSAITADDATATVEFAQFTPFRQALAQWQRGLKPQDEGLWGWIRNNVTIQLKLIHVDPTEPVQRRESPFQAVLVFDVAKADEFAAVFKAAML